MSQRGTASTRSLAVLASLFALSTNRDALADDEVPNPKRPPKVFKQPNPDASALADDGHPLAGYHSDLAFLRDAHDNFRVYLQARGQIDAYTYFGPGVTETALKPTLFLRRVRPEITGELFRRWHFMIAGDFGATGLDNPKGANETFAAPPGTAPTAATARYAGPEGVKLSAAPTDVFIHFHAHDFFNMQVGQFDAPFTMENRTSDKYIPFMERSLAVRDVGIPSNKEIGLMIWGEDQQRTIHYEAGVFNGDGQNRLNTDARADFIGRVFLHPLREVTKTEIGETQVGFSGRYGSRDQAFTDYDYPALTTQGAYGFWSPTYSGSNGQEHVLQSGDQLGLAAELRVPFWRFDVTGELVVVRNDTREALDGFQATTTDRWGRMFGYSYYAELGLWVFGKRDLIGLPGYENLPHLDFAHPDPVTPPHALQLLAKWEQLHLNYQSAIRGGKADVKNIDGDIDADAFSIGVNYWWTKHIRLTTNYVLNYFPRSEPSKQSTPTSPAQTSDQRAISPGNSLAAGTDDKARDGAHVLHELLFRVAVAL